jgi:hypothetical protein
MEMLLDIITNVSLYLGLGIVREQERINKLGCFIGSKFGAVLDMVTDR